MAPQRSLGKHQLAIHGHLEQAARGLDQAHRGFRVQGPELSRQTGGQRLIVSHYAILNVDPHGAEANFGPQRPQGPEGP